MVVEPDDACGSSRRHEKRVANNRGICRGSSEVYDLKDELPCGLMVNGESKRRSVSYH